MCRLSGSLVFFEGVEDEKMQSYFFAYSGKKKYLCIRFLENIP